MFPLEKRNQKGYKFGQRTFYGVKHTGTDYEANYVDYYAPFNGVATSGSGYQGGKFWTLKTPDGLVFTARHLSKILKVGNVREGDLVAVTGNTGAFTTNPHLHQEVISGEKLVDPEIVVWGQTAIQKTFMGITVVANKNNWTNLPVKLDELKQMFITESSGKFEPVFNIKQTNFDTIPLSPFLGQEGTKSVDVNWYRTNITPLATGQATLFLINEADYNNGLTWGFMTYGDPHRPVRIEVASGQNGSNQFVERAFHEISHCLQFLTGQPDRTHELLYQSPPQTKALMDYIDQKKLQAQLVVIH